MGILEKIADAIIKACDDGSNGYLIPSIIELGRAEKLLDAINSDIKVEVEMEQYEPCVVEKIVLETKSFRITWARFSVSVTDF